MASSYTRVLALMVIVEIISLTGGSHQVSAQCGGAIPALIGKCKSFVLIPGPQIPPSSECCAVIKTADVPCLCNFLTPIIEKIVSMEKVVFVARTCGLTVPPGMKCGSYTVPPARE
ncbi:Bifunctional inhibitor/plant lipid transfer protein/seed storage helical domain [Dillenia turbinata]|uniref:Bifunctional inhibitor/plant lipid transfer protein/seed storage helical domain n=1 Tax=Dillenia turbinata TaxID=194707 RepID=A0AAN8VQC4_9MAGN